MFFNSFDHIFTSKVFKITIQKLSRNCLLKNLINDGGVPYSLFIQNMIEGADKSSAGERVTFRKSFLLDFDIVETCVYYCSCFHTAHILDELFSTDSRPIAQTKRFSWISIRLKKLRLTCQN